MLIFTSLFLVAIWAGIQNALAGGGTFITFPTLLMAGLDARAANITSTIALFPGQITTALAGRSKVAGTEHLLFRALIGLSLIGGVLGAALLLLTRATSSNAWCPSSCCSLRRYSPGEVSCGVLPKPICTWVAMLRIARNLPLRCMAATSAAASAS